MMRIVHVVAIEHYNAKQKHLGCKKVRGQSEATYFHKYDWFCHLATFYNSL